MRASAFNSEFTKLQSKEGDRVYLFAIVLEVLDHKEYDRKFGYKTS